MKRELLCILATLFLLLLNCKIRAQCTSCSATTFTVNLSSKADTAWTLTNTTRSGSCCAGSNCVKFIVYVNAGSDLLNFNVTNPAPSGSAFYQINCGASVSIGSPACISGGAQTMCITYCKPGGDSPDYHIIASKTVRASDDFTVRTGCAKTMTIAGLSASTVTWTSISPGTLGQYNSYLSCSQGCATTVITPSAATPTRVAYRVSGSPLSGCPGTNVDTVNVTIVPGLSLNITPANPVICSGSGSTVPITATVAGGQTPYSYTWSTGATTQSVNAGIGNYTVFANDNTAGCVALNQTVAVQPVNTPSAPTVSSNGPLCAGQTLSLTASAAGSTYSWSGPSSFTSTAQNPVIPSVTAAQSGTYSVSSTFSGCTGPAGTVAVTVTPIPATPTISSNSPVCAAQTLSLSAATVAGVSYSWTGPGGFTSSLQNPTIANSTTVMSGTYSLTLWSANCAGATATTAVTVNQTPAAPIVSGNSTLCAGSSINLAANPGGLSYSWSGPNGFTSTAQNPVITSASTLATGMYSVTASIGSCTGPAGTFSVTVLAVPAVPTPSANTPVCTGRTLSLTAPFIPGATYQWSGPGGFTSSNQSPTITNVTAATAGNYSLSITAGGCGSSATLIAVTVNTTPAAPLASGTTTLCEGGTIQLNASSVAGAYFWSGPNSFTASTQNASVVGASTLATGNYSVTQTVNGCVSNPGTVSITVIATPSAPAVTGNATLCSGQTLSLTASGSGAFAWSGPGGFTSNQQTVLLGATSFANGTFSVTRTVQGCTSPPGTIQVVVINIPSTPTVTANSPLCALQTLSLSALGSGTYSWTGPNSFTSVLQNPVISTISTTASGTYSVTQTVNGCASPAGTVSVVVNPAAPTPTITSNSPVCLNQNIVFTQVAITNATYSWGGPNGFSSSAQNPTISSAGLAASGSYSVFAVVAGCAGSVTVLSVSVTSPGTISAGVSPVVCANNATVVLTGTSSTGSGTWVSSGTGTFTPNAVNGNYIPSAAEKLASVAHLTVTSTNNGGCPPVSSSTSVQITPAPTAFAGADATVCANNAAVQLSGSVTIATGGTWTSSGTGSFSSGSALTTTYIPSAADISAGSFTITLTTTGNGNCIPVPDSKVITISPAPVVNPGANPQVVCKNNPNFQLNGSSTTGSGVWASSGTGSFSTVNSLNPTYFPSTADTTAGNITLTLTSTSNGACNSVSQTMSIVYVSTITVNAGTSGVVCTNSPISLNGVSTTSAGVWTSSGTGTFSPSASSIVTTYIPSQADITAGVVSFTLTTANNGGCLPLKATRNATIIPGPTASAGPNQTVCANNPSVALSGSFNLAGGVQWSSAGTGVFFPSSTNSVTSYFASAADTTAGSIVISISTTSNGLCSATTSTMLLSFNHAPVVNAGVDISRCKSSPVATLTGVSSTSAGSWSTLGSGMFFPNNNTIVTAYYPGLQDVATGSVTIIFTSANNALCLPTNDTLRIFYTPQPTITAGPDPTVCANNASVALTSTSSTGSGVWTTSGAGTFTPNAMNAVYIPSSSDISSGLVVFTVTSTGNGACAPVADSLNVFITPAPTADAGSDLSLCASIGSVNLNGNITVATSGSWTSSGSGTFTPGNAGLNIAYLLSPNDTIAGSVKLFLHTTGNGNCLMVSDSVLVSFVKPAQPLAGPDLVVCPSSPPPSLNGTCTACTWTTTTAGTFTPGNNIPDPVFLPTTPGGTIYLVLSMSSSECGTSSDTARVFYRPAPVARYSVANRCFGDSAAFIDLSESAAEFPIVERIWLFNGDTSRNVSPSVKFANPGPHAVTLKVFNGGCTDTLARTVYINPVPTATITSKIRRDSLFFNVSHTISSGKIGSWSWNFGDDQFSSQRTGFHIYSAPGDYIVKVRLTSDSACFIDVSDTVKVSTDVISSDLGEPAVPNAFTPNGDGHNDVLRVKGIPYLKLDFRIFNEWGNQVFRSEIQSVGWDGTSSGSPVPVGKYVYTVDGQAIDGRKVSMAGEVLLIR